MRWQSCRAEFGLRFRTTTQFTACGSGRRRNSHTHTLIVDVTLAFAPLSTERVLGEVFSRKYVKKLAPLRRRVVSSQRNCNRKCVVICEFTLCIPKKPRSRHFGGMNSRGLFQGISVGSIIHRRLIFETKPGNSSIPVTFVWAAHSNRFLRSLRRNQPRVQDGAPLQYPDGQDGNWM